MKKFIYWIFGRHTCGTKFTTEYKRTSSKYPLYLVTTTCDKCNEVIKTWVWHAFC